MQILLVDLRQQLRVWISLLQLRHKLGKGLAVLLCMRSKRLNIRRNECKWVVDLMGYTGDQCSQRGKFFKLDNRILMALQLGNTLLQLLVLFKELARTTFNDRLCRDTRFSLTLISLFVKL